jgi:uncharacterized membrane protein YphA (DoxX/SURF4 family)
MMKKAYKTSIIVSQIIVGLVFLFSGFVKAVDPLGSTYKFIDYFRAFGMGWLEPTAFPLAFVLSGLEFLIGACLVLFIYRKIANWLALIFMAFFTPLTLWLAFNDPVHDCGCFGDALILTNWQTFFKNIIILVFTLLSFVGRNQLLSWAKFKTEAIITASIALAITIFSWYNLEHLPVFDFRPYKVGVNIPEKMKIPDGAPKDVYMQFFTIKDTVNNKTIEIDSQKYTSDSTYWGQGTKWKFIASGQPKLVSKGYTPPIHDFDIVSLSGTSILQEVMTDSGYYFVLVAYNLKHSREKHQPAINQLAKQALTDNYHFICLTSSGMEDIYNFKQKWQMPYDFYTGDQITLKTIIRANPGLVLLHKGTILAKWHSNDIPDYKTIKETYFK